MQQLAISLLQRQAVTVCQIMFFWSMPISCQQRYTTLPIVSCHSKQHHECLSFSCSLILIFLLIWPTDQLSICNWVVVLLSLLSSCVIFVYIYSGYIVNGKISYVAYIFACFCHECMSSNWVYALFIAYEGIFVASTYFAIIW